MSVADKEIRKKIAEVSVKYLRDRMLINQEVIAGKEDNVSFETFMMLYNKYKECIDFYNRDMKRRKKDVVEIDGKKIPMRTVIVHLRNELIRTKAQSIILTKEEIDELMGYVKESIELYGFGDNACSQNETYFLRQILRNLLDHMSQDITDETRYKYQAVSSFYSYVGLTDDQGFCPKLIGRVYVGYDNMFEIRNHEYNKVCQFDKNGVNVINKPLEEEIFIADKMYMGSILTSDGRKNNVIFLEVIEDGEKKVKSIFNDNQVYDIYDRENNPSGNVILSYKFNDFLDFINFGFLKQDIYDRSSLINLMDSLKNSLSMSAEDKEKIDEATDAAVNWWADGVYRSIFDDSYNTPIEDLAMLNYLKKISFQQETIEKFKVALGNKIKASLFKDPSYFELIVDYHPDTNILDAAREAKLVADFPWKTCMNISKDEVSVTCGEGSQKEILYTSQEKMTEITKNYYN